MKTNNHVGSIHFFMLSLIIIKYYDRNDSMSDYQEQEDSLTTLFTRASMTAVFDAHGNHGVDGFMLTAAD